MDEKATQKLTDAVQDIAQVKGYLAEHMEDVEATGNAEFIKAFKEVPLIMDISVNTAKEGAVILFKELARRMKIIAEQVQAVTEEVCKQIDTDTAKCLEAFGDDVSNPDVQKAFLQLAPKYKRKGAEANLLTEEELQEYLDNEDKREELKREFLAKYADRFLKKIASLEA